MRKSQTIGVGATAAFFLLLVLETIARDHAWTHRPSTGLTQLATHSESLFRWIGRWMAILIGTPIISLMFNLRLVLGGMFDSLIDCLHPILCVCASFLFLFVGYGTEISAIITTYVNYYTALVKKYDFTILGGFSWMAATTAVLTVVGLIALLLRKRCATRLLTHSVDMFATDAAPKAKAIKKKE